MKALYVFISVITMLLGASCNSQTLNKPVPQESGSGNSDIIEAYYFHFTARCVTCRTIEADTKKNLEALYPEYTKAGLITFQSINLDEGSSGAIAKKLGVSGQALLLVKGNQKINLTNEGFLYAVQKPEKFKEIINEKVEFLLTAE
jgi:hypothetical protein